MPASGAAPGEPDEGAGGRGRGPGNPGRIDVRRGRTGREPKRPSVGRRSGWCGRVWRAWNRQPSFGPLVAAEAQERDFYEAQASGVRGRRGGVQLVDPSGYFADFEPIVDLLHVVCYLYSSARAVGADEPSGGRCTWRGCGRVGRAGSAEVVARVGRVAGASGRPPPGEGDGGGASDPRRVVAEARSVLEEQPGADGLPAVPPGGVADDEQSGGVAGGRVQRAGEGQAEVLEPSGGAEAILQLRAAVLSEDDRLARFFAQRPGCPFRKRDTLSHESEDAPDANRGVTSQGKRARQGLQWVLRSSAHGIGNAWVAFAATVVWDES